jgi:DNA-binding SARP family transcriptional activator
MHFAEPKINKTTPPLLPDVIHRKRLFKWLDSRRHYTISWLTGPAGSGKTTLLADYLKHSGSDFIWYRLDRQDEDLSLFFSHLAKTAKQAVRKTGYSIPALDKAYLMRPLEFSRRFFENLGHYLSDPFWLIFDNYHEISPDSLLQTVIKEGLLRLPPSIHTFILSRETPPKQYSGLIANHQLRQIQNRDLAFTLEETAAVLRLETGKNWPPAFITELHEKTEGWVVGLILTAKGLNSLKTDSLSFNDRLFDRVYDYFAAELFDRTDPQVKNFLLISALLPRIIPAIVETLTGLARTETLLKSLFKYHYFIEQYETRPVVYQFHPLFHEFLLAQSKKAFSKQETKSLQCRAAVLFETHGFLSEALLLYQQAHQFESIVKIILTHSKAMILQNRYKTVAAWVELLPEKTIHRNPWLNYWRGFGYKFEDPMKAKNYFRRAFDQFNKTRNPEGLLISWSGAVDAINMGLTNFKELDYYLKWFNRNIQTGYPFPSTEIEAYFLSSALMALRMRNPQHPDLEHWMERALFLSDKNQDPFLPILIHFTVIMVLQYKQTQPEKIESLRTNLHYLAWQGDSDFFKCWDAYIEILSFFWRDLTAETAQEIVAQTAYITQKADFHFLDEYVFAVGVISALMLGNYKEASRFLSFFENSLKYLKKYEVFSIYYHVKTLYHLDQREMEPALEAGYLAEQAARNSGFVMNQIRNDLSLAGVLILSQKYTEALHYISAAQRQADKFKSPILAYQADLFKAYLLLCQNRKKQGLRYLRQALSFGRRHGFIRFIWWWNRELLTDICRLALENGIEVDFIRQVIRSYRLQPPASRPAMDGWFWQVEVETLGPFNLKVDGRYLEYRKKAKVVQLEMLKVLVALGPNPVAVGKVMALLWPDKNNEQATSAFSSTLSRLRQLLGLKEAIRVQNARIGLDPSYCKIDCQCFERLVQQARFADKHPEDRERFNLYEKAVHIYQGRFLEGEPESSWILEKQEKLKAQYIYAVTELGTWHERRHKPNQALALYKQALAFEPAEESLYRRIMMVQIRLKQTTEALKTYLRCKKALHTAMGTSPSEQMEKIYLQLTNATMTVKSP